MNFQKLGKGRIKKEKKGDTGEYWSEARRQLIEKCEVKLEKRKKMMVSLSITSKLCVNWLLWKRFNGSELQMQMSRLTEKVRFPWSSSSLCFNQGGLKKWLFLLSPLPHWTKMQMPPDFFPSHNWPLIQTYLVYNRCASPHLPLKLQWRVWSLRAEMLPPRESDGH